MAVRADGLDEMEKSLVSSKRDLDERVRGHNARIVEMVSRANFDDAVNEICKDFETGLTGPIRLMVPASAENSPKSKVRVGFPLISGVVWVTTRMDDVRGYRSMVESEAMKKLYHDRVDAAVLGVQKVVNAMWVGPNFSKPKVSDKVFERLDTVKIRQRICGWVETLPSLIDEHMASDRFKAKRGAHERRVNVRRVRDASLRALKKCRLPSRDAFVAVVRGTDRGDDFKTLLRTVKEDPDARRFVTYYDPNPLSIEVTDEEIGDVWDKLAVRDVQER